jgi:serine/threonine protein kinase
MPYNAIGRKLRGSNLFNCDNISGFVASILQVLPFKGVSMSRFYMCEYEGVRFLTKLCFYRKTPIELYGKPSKSLTSYVDSEINILKILRETIIDKNISPCILELVFETICDGLEKMSPGPRNCEHVLLDSTSDDDVRHLICGYNDLVKNGLAHNKCAFLVLERCDMTLEDYLLKSVNTPVSAAVFKSLMFMIIYTMYAINRLYPRFRHYDLHTANIMLKFDPNYKFKSNNPKFLVITIDDETYSVPYFGIIPKIIDFGFSTMPEKGVTSGITEDKLHMYYRSENDLLFLFHWIHHTVSHSSVDKQGRIERLLSKLDPTRAYVNYYTEHIRKIEQSIPTYETMVKNKIWDEYRNVKATKTQIYNEFTPIAEVEKMNL